MYVWCLLIQHLSETVKIQRKFLPEGGQQNWAQWEFPMSIWAELSLLEEQLPARDLTATKSFKEERK